MAVHGHWNSWGVGLCAEEHWLAEHTHFFFVFYIYYVIHLVSFNLENREKEFKLREVHKDEDQAFLSVFADENKVRVIKVTGNIHWKLDTSGDYAE